MDATRLPLLNPFMMAPVVLLAAPVGARAKRSVAARNTALLIGFAVLIAGNLAFAMIPSVTGEGVGFLGKPCCTTHHRTALHFARQNRHWSAESFGWQQVFRRRPLPLHLGMHPSMLQVCLSLTINMQTRRQ